MDLTHSQFNHFQAKYVSLKIYQMDVIYGSFAAFEGSVLEKAILLLHSVDM